MLHKNPHRKTPKLSPRVDRKAAATAIDSFLRALGRNPDAEPDLVGTGQRVADAYIDELCSGYAVSPNELLEQNRIRVATFDKGVAGIESARTAIALHNAPISAICPHHLLPSTGVVSVIFSPQNYIVGVGALHGAAEALAKRFTLQETLTEKLLVAIAETLKPRWVACRTQLSHGCMTLRGERAHGSQMIVLATRGISEVDATALLSNQKI
jgi:GTP cyclohydrolase IA